MLTRKRGRGGGKGGGGSVGLAVVLGALQLNLQPLHADLEAVHGLDGGLRGHRVVIADEACGRKRRRKRRREAYYTLYGRCGGGI